MSFVDPVSKEKYTSCYNKGETYQTLFGDISTSYEECRADLSGLFLQTYEPMFNTFGYSQKDTKDLLFTSMQSEVRKGIQGMPSAYDKSRKKWKQAHTQGAFVITNFIVKNQKSKIIEFPLNEN